MGKVMQTDPGSITLEQAQKLVNLLTAGQQEEADHFFQTVRNSAVIQQGQKGR